MRKIGIFGGSFNPIHTGHAILANYLSQHGGFDEIWLLPDRLNPLKSGEEAPAPFDDRMAMARTVAEQCDRVGVCGIENELPEPSYTITTLRELSRRNPDCSFSIIVGSDNWALFDKWREHDAIIRDFGVTVYPRPGYPVAEPLPGNVTLVKDVPQILVSSTMIRSELRAGANINFLVPHGVINYIKQNNLYHHDGGK